MSELSELYGELILDHNRKPRNFHKLESANRMAEGYNPFCGDRFTVYLNLEDDVIREISFLGSGCAISKASASLMTTSLKDRTKVEAQALFEKVHKMLTGAIDSSANKEDLGKLAVLSRISQFPVRVKCASLAWHTMLAALEGREERVSTE